MFFSIPKSFNLGGQKITVKSVKAIQNGQCSGMAYYERSCIELDEDLEGDYKEFVFFHELIHHIFNQCGEDKLRANEKLVDQMATFLHQAIKTMK